MTGKFSRTMDKKNWLHFEYHYSYSVRLFLRSKKSRENVIKVSAVILNFLLVFHCSIDTTAINRKWYILIVHCFIEATAISLNTAPTVKEIFMAYSVRSTVGKGLGCFITAKQWPVPCFLYLPIDAVLKLVRCEALFVWIDGQFQWNVWYLQSLFGKRQLIFCRAFRIYLRLCKAYVVLQLD